MRIDCEACGAPFAVDESRIPESGARASCPRCRHQVVLRRPSVAAPPPDPLALQFDRTPGSGYSTSVTTDSGRFGTGERTLAPLPPDPLERDGQRSGDYAVPNALSAMIASAVGRITGSYTAPATAAEASLNQAMGLVPPSHVTAEMTPVTGPTPVFGTAPPYDSSPAWDKTPTYGTFPPGVLPPGVLPSGVGLGSASDALTPPMFGPPGNTPAFPMAVPTFPPAGRVSESTPAPRPVPVPAMVPAPAPPASGYPADAFKSFDVDDLFNTIPGAEARPGPPVRTPAETDPGGELSAKFLRGESQTDPIPTDDDDAPLELKTGTIPVSLEPTGPNVLDATGPILEPSPVDADEWRIRKPESIVEGPFSGPELPVALRGGAHPAGRPRRPRRRLLPAALRVRVDVRLRQGPRARRPRGQGVRVDRAGRVALARRPDVARHRRWRGGRRAHVQRASDSGSSEFRSRRPTPAPSPSSSRGGRRKHRRWPVPARPTSSRAATTPRIRDGYRKAADAYKRVLIKTPTDVKAMCGYAEVRAVLAIEEGDGTGLQESAELLGYALRNGGLGAGPHVARANLLVASGTAGDLLSAQSEAGLARRIAPEDPDVLLAVGRAFVMTNAEYALEAIEKAKKIVPDSRQIPVLLGQAYLQLGRIAEARAQFELRKKMVPGDGTADLLLANLDASIGRFDRARTRLALAGRLNPGSVDVRIQLAIIAYEVDNDLKTAHEERREAARPAARSKAQAEGADPLGRGRAGDGERRGGRGADQVGSGARPRIRRRCSSDWPSCASGRGALTTRSITSSARPSR